VGEFWRLAGAALLGAVISCGTTLYVERRKERRAERQEAQQRDCCDLSEFWQQHLETTQNPIRSAVQAVHPILHPEDGVRTGRGYTARSA
jgi:hypothetical protein